MDNDSSNIFVYGTLMFASVWQRLVQGNYSQLPAVLHGYSRRQIHGEIYPGIKSHSDSSVNGVLYQGVSASDLQILDAFESHYYQRRTVSVLTADSQTLAAEVYEFHPRHYHLLAREDWDCEEFRRQHLQSFMQHYTNW